MSKSIPTTTTIARLNNLISRELILFAHDYGISGATARVLNFLGERGKEKTYQRDVEAALGIRPSTATVLLQQMDAKGLITRRQTSSDKRYKQIRLTARANAALGAVSQEIAGINTTMEAGVPAKDLATFQRVLDKMITNLS